VLTALGAHAAGFAAARRCLWFLVCFFNSSVKIELILIIFDAQILRKFDISGYEFVHHIWKNITTLSCESCVATGKLY